MAPKAEYQRARRAAIKAGTWKKDKSPTTSFSGTIESTGQTLDASNSNSLSELETMAKRGQIPERILMGSTEERERIYEAIDRLYPDPPGILGDYRVEQVGGRSLQVSFNYAMAEAESPSTITLPSRKSSDSVRAGAIKQAIYTQRPRVENALLTRKGGYTSYDLATKYGKRVLSAAEKAEADRKMIAFVERLMGSPMSKGGHEYNQAAWLKRNGGYVRAGALDASDYGIRATRNGVEI